MSALTDIRACVFDAYGTLFDVHSAVARHRARLGDKADGLSRLWRSKQLEYTWLRTLMRRHADFWQVTGDALDFALDAHGLEDMDLRQALMQAYLQLDCYPEVPGMLERLGQADLQRAILSNGSPRMLTAAVGNSGLEQCFEAVLSIEQIGIYKPDPRVYRLAVDQLRVPAERICFMSSNAWDVAGAVSFGFRVVWINRFGQCPERLGMTPQAVLSDLTGLSALLGLD